MERERSESRTEQVSRCRNLYGKELRSKRLHGMSSFSRSSPRITDRLNFIPKNKESRSVSSRSTRNSEERGLVYRWGYTFLLHFYFPVVLTLTEIQALHLASLFKRTMVDITKAYLCQVILLLLSKTRFYISFHCCVFLHFVVIEVVDDKKMEQTCRPASTMKECSYS